MRNVIMIIIVCAVSALICAGPVNAERLEKPPSDEISRINNENKSGLYFSSGYFLSHEGSLNGGPSAGLGYNKCEGRDKLSIEVRYAQTKSKQAIAGYGDEVGHTITEMGVAKNIGKRRSDDIGAGVQVHQMNIKNYGRMTKITLFGFGEYNFTSRMALRIKAALPAKDGHGLIYGDYLTVDFVYRMN